MTRSPEPSSKERIEPTTDWSGLALAAREQSRSSAPAWRDRKHWRWIAGGLLLLLIALVLLRQPLSEWLWSASRVQNLLSEGDAALQRGHLSSADGSGARQKFEAAQAMDNDRSEARAGLSRVANAALGQARAAIADDDYAKALSMLTLARELQAPGAQTAAVSEELRTKQATKSGVAQWLQRAKLAVADGKLDGGEDAALPLYRRVLNLQPENTDALEGREDAISDLLMQAGKALAAGDLPRGAALVSASQGYDAGHVGLPEARAELSQAIEKRRLQADSALRRKRLPQASVAYQSLQAAAHDASTKEAATRGLEQVALAYVAQSRIHAADFRFEQAQADLTQAQALAPTLAEVRDASEYLQRVRQGQAQRQASVSPQAQRQVRILLADMQKAEARGDWVSPPGDSAYDKLRAAQSLSPRDPAVVAAAKRMVPATRKCFDDQLRANRPRAANACYDAWANLAPGLQELGAARRRLAAKWVAVGNEQLSGGNLQFAREAVQRARSLDSKAAGLAELSERVAGARLP